MVDLCFYFGPLLLLSVLGFLLIDQLLIPSCRNMFLSAGLAGKDMAKRDKKSIPEAQGVLCGTVYLMILFCFIPVAFYSTVRQDAGQGYFDLLEYMSALSTICFMIFLGFADDVLNLPWRVKLVLPTIASVPLLTVYAVNINSTTIIVPKPFRFLLGFDLNLGPLYYLYMAMLAVFCTNAVNIYAGVNGLEVGQSLVISLSILVFNACEISGKFWQGHVLSVYLLLPYVFVSAALLKHNWYPSAVFVGDTFCYFSGMTFAVAGILGHFSKTMLLFFLPQIANFLYSTPQLFHLVPCPRHRLPKYCPEADKVTVSSTEFRLASLPLLGRLAVRLLAGLRLVRLRPKAGEEGRAEPLLECSNLTVLNLVLLVTGPLHERTLVLLLLLLQVFSSCIAFGIRYPMASLFYDV